MPKTIYHESIFGETIRTHEGSLETHTPMEQWHGWLPRGGRHRPGLRDQYRTKFRDVQWIVDYIQGMIDAGFTFKGWDGKTMKVINEYEEERFYEDLEELRDYLNDAINDALKRRPLKRRIELLQQVIDLKSEPEEKANAAARIEVLKRRLKEES